MSNPRLLFRVGMKILGLWAVLYGTIEVARNILSLMLFQFQGALAWADLGQAGLAMFFPNAAFIAVSVYLLIGGQWVVDVAFAGGPGACPACGYPMQHSNSSHCPECGTTAPSATPAATADRPGNQPAS